MEFKIKMFVQPETKIFVALNPFNRGSSRVWMITGAIRARGVNNIAFVLLPFNSSLCLINSCWREMKSVDKFATAMSIDGAQEYRTVSSAYMLYLECFD